MRKEEYKELMICSAEADATENQRRWNRERNKNNERGNALQTQDEIVEMSWCQKEPNSLYENMNEKCEQILFMIST